jgi:hypothetical protein
VEFRKTENELLLIAVVVLVDGSCRLGLGLELRVCLRTNGYFVLWERRPLWCCILAGRRLGRCFILCYLQTLNWICSHLYLPFITPIGLAGRNFSPYPVFSILNPVRKLRKG